MTRLAPGSAPWLLRHELRLAWRRWRAGGRQVATTAAAVLIAALVQVACLFLARWLIDARLPETAWLAGATAVLAFAGLMMLAQALRIAIEGLYERHDLDWLLTSPIPLRRVLAARMAAAVVRVAGTWLLLLVGPLAVGLAVNGRPGALAAYPVLLALALLMTAAGTASAVLLVSLLGLRRARGVVSGLVVVTTSAGFLAGQSHTMLTPAQREALLGALLVRHGAGAAWLPARAMLGEPGPLLLVVAVAVAVAALTARALERRFASGAAHDPAARTRRAARHQAAPRFRAGAGRALLHKEMRLLRRSPGLLGRTLSQMVYLLPALLPLLRGAKETLLVAAVATVFVTGEVARILISATISGDGAADLARSAPVPPRGVRRAKVQATGLCLAALLALPLLYVTAERARLLPTLVLGLVGVSGSAVLLAWRRPAASRAGDLGGSRNGLSGSDWLNLAVSASWAGVTWLATWLASAWL